MHNHASYAILILAAASLSAGATRAATAPQGNRTTALQALTGARTRVAWCQDSGDGRDVFAKGMQLRLMGFDSGDRAGERVILGTPGNYARPLFAPDGGRVIFTDRRKPEVFTVDWDGRGLKKLAPGCALDARQDPATGRTWVYAARGRLAGSRIRYEQVVRFPLDAPRQSETVWDRGPITADNFQVSSDGARAGGLFPWPEAGMAALPNVGWHKLGRGCWTSLAPDNSYLFWIFDGAHRNVTLFTGNGTQSRQIPINTAPDINGFEVYHPRWSNHVRFLALTGPYLVGEGGNKIRAGGKGVEIHVGRFAADFSRVEAWARVTRNERADFYPDVWVEGGEHASLQTDKPPPVPELTAQWPGTEQGLVFLWENSMAMNEIPLPGSDRRDACRITARGHAHYGRHFDMILAGGAFAAETGHDRVLAACRASNELTLETVLTPLALEQEGPARIITFSTDTGRRNFTLGQQGEELVLRLRTPRTGPNGTNPETILCRVEAKRTYHLLVSYRPGRLQGFLDGQPLDLRQAVRGDFSNWSAQRIVFGDEDSGGRDWSGRLEGVAMYNRAVDRQEAAAHFQLYAAKLAGRKPVPAFRVRGRLTETVPTPAADAMGEYRRALALYTYAVAQLPGTGEQGELVVAHWVVMDAERLPVTRRIGATYDLHLERWEDHPQLDSELRADTDRIELPVFCDVGPIGQAAPAGN